MSLGKMSDWTKLYDSKDVRCNNENDLRKANDALAHVLAAFQYTLRVPGAIYGPVLASAQWDADILIECAKDWMAVIPPGGKFKAFKQGVANSLGFVVVSAQGNLSLYDPGDDNSTANAGGLTFQSVGDYQGRTVFARLDRTAITALQNGKTLSALQLGVYETAMKKGVIASGGTGSDGIKFDNQTWVIKITISIASANQMNNNLSPMATIVQSDKPKSIFLNFNQLTLRH
jgi:hypothetical protein